MNENEKQFADLIEDFTNLANTVLPKNLEQAGYIAGKEVQQEARSLSAIDTGALRRSITETLTNISSGVSVIVSPTEPYAGAIEFGQPPDTYVSPEALKGWVRRHGMPESAAYAISKSIMRKGTKAQPFLFPAFEKKLQTIFDIISQGVTNALQQSFNN